MPARKKNVYIVIGEKTGLMIPIGKKLPIYWNRSEARIIAKGFYAEVFPISYDSLLEFLRKETAK